MSSFYHTEKQHEGNTKHGRACPYCTRGSEIIPDEMLVVFKRLRWDEKKIAEYVRRNRSIEELL